MHKNDVRLQDPQALTTRATDGDEDAFRSLYARNAGLTWRFAYALTGTTRDAVDVVSDSFARTFTMLRRSDSTAPEFRTLLLQTTRHAAIDARAAHEVAPPFEATAETLALATAFASLPERWRSALWLGTVEGTDDVPVAAVIGLGADDTARITARARKGLREQYLRADVDRSDDRNCGRAVDRLGPYIAGTLPTADIELLERHLRLCATCDARCAALTSLTDRLPLLVPALPALLEDDVLLAWAGAVAAPGGLGISPLGEKILAGVAALAAGVGVLGAALASVSGSGGDDVAVSPIAPLVAELAAPRPEGLDLSIDLAPGDGAGSAASDGRDDVFDRIRPTSASGDGDGPIQPDLGGTTDDDTSGTPGTSTDTAGPDGGDTGGPTPPPAPDPTPDSPMVSVGTDVGGLPIAVELGTDPGVTVGPISIGSEPTPGPGTIAVGGPLEPLAPVVDPVNDALGGLLGG